MENMTIQSIYFPPLPLNFYFKTFWKGIFVMPEKIKVYDAIIMGEVKSAKH